MAAAMLGGNAAAQTATQTPTASGDEEIVVTGTRVTRPGTVSASPIATVNSEEIQLQQPSNIETVLRQMPQFVAGDGGQVNNGSSGAATLDLRGLTPPRTLVLVDGHRMPGFDFNGLFDVSTVPVDLLRRVDVVTGGASAVYGSDAVAGVVNFVLRDDFQGAQLSFSRSQMENGDGQSDTYWLTMGANLADGRGNVALSVGHSERAPVYQTFGPAAQTPGASSTTNPAAIDSGGGRVQFDFNWQLGAVLSRL